MCRENLPDFLQQQLQRCTPPEMFPNEQQAMPQFPQAPRRTEIAAVTTTDRRAAGRALRELMQTLGLDPRLVIHISCIC